MAQHGRSRQDRIDVYAQVTNAIVAAIECGGTRYRMPWHHDGALTSRPVNAVSGKTYRGANTLLLWAAAEANGYATGRWATYRGWASLGAQVRKGERSTMVVFWKMFRKDGDDRDAGGSGDDDDTDGRPRFMARGYSVFNQRQVDGYEPPTMKPLDEATRHAGADAFFANLNIPLVSEGDQAFYRPSTDTIHMPPFRQFRDWQSFVSVRQHEAGHASGAKHRLDRDLTGRFGSEAYAGEELVAEISAALALADLGIAHEPRPDHAAYVASWLAVLKNDTRAIFTAASKAQAAVDWMHAQQPCAAGASMAESIGDSAGDPEDATGDAIDSAAA
ncbi:MAG: ArdC family protein [Beijerinckiaceae bacterium]